MKVLFVVSEVFPFAKTGGLADVAGSLPLELSKLGHDIRVVMPYYRKVTEYLAGNALPCKLVQSNKEVTLPFGQSLVKSYDLKVWQSHFPDNPKVPIYFLDLPEFFDRSDLYVDASKKGFSDNAQRYAYFSQALDPFVKGLGWNPEVLHLHDWHTGLVALGVKERTLFADLPPPLTVFTIHNMAYQGTFPLVVASELGLDQQPFANHTIEGERLNFLKTGIVCADVVTTVSEKYRDELLTPEFGYGLEQYLQTRQESFVGILNGVDYSQWTPRSDLLLPATYSAEDQRGKMICKRELLTQQGLEPDLSIPTVGMVTRLGWQKGIDLIIEALPTLLEQRNFYLVFVGTGNVEQEEALKALGEKYPTKLAVNIAFSNQLAHLVEAGSDFFLMPSRYEPCGLNQMYSLRYGTLPIVRNTGGLADTVRDLTKNPTSGNGFSFEEYEVKALVGAVERALTYHTSLSTDELATVRKRVMEEDYSWLRSAQKYHKLYIGLAQK